MTSPDSPLLILLITWNMISPSFRMRDYIAGHKSSLFSGAGILLTLSLFFSLFMHVGVVCFLGHANIFLVPLPLAIVAFGILITKSVVDRDFRDQPLGEKITYSLLAAIFPLSSQKPAREEEEKPGAVIAKGEKNAYSELTLLHLLHLLTTLAGTGIFVGLIMTNSAFNEGMGKIESSSGVRSVWVICVGCPAAFVGSILARLLYNRVEPWRMVRGPLNRSCCSCCPLTLKSSYEDVAVKIEAPRVVENPAAEVEEIFDSIAERRQQQV